MFGMNSMCCVWYSLKSSWWILIKSENGIFRKYSNVSYVENGYVSEMCAYLEPSGTFTDKRRKDYKKIYGYTNELEFWWQ